MPAGFCASLKASLHVPFWQIASASRLGAPFSARTIFSSLDDPYPEKKAEKIRRTVVALSLHTFPTLQNLFKKHVLVKN